MFLHTTPCKGGPKMDYNHYRDMATKDLALYNHLKISLDLLPRQIALLKNSGIAVGGTRERVMQSVTTDDAVVAHIARIEDMENILQQNRSRIACIDSALEVLGSKDRELLCTFYINRQRNTVKNYANKHFTDRSSVYRRAQRALERYILVCYGVPKP